MRSAKDFFKPLALGAPEPLSAVPTLPSRMIHFFDPSNPKMASRLPELAQRCDVVLGNLEDGCPAERKIEAREGFIKLVRDTDFAGAQVWTRVNCLDSPWGLDDFIRLIGEIGDKLDVIMVPKVNGVWDIHYVDQLMAQLEAKAGLKTPILVNVILESHKGFTNAEAICGASPRMQGLSLGPADLAAARGMKTTRVGGPHPDYVVRSDADESDPGAPRATFQQDVWHYSLSRMIDACTAEGILPYYGPFGDIQDTVGCEDQFRNAYLLGCVGGWTLHPKQIDIARKVFTPRAVEVVWAKRVLDVMSEGGAIMVDGKMQDEATLKQCEVVLDLAKLLAKREPELCEAYEFTDADLSD